MEENKNIEPEVVVAKSDKEITGAGNQAIISLVLGIFGIFLSWIIIGVVFGVFAIKLGKESRKTLGPGDGKYIIGLIGGILGWITVVATIVFLAIYIYAFAVAAEMIREYGYEYFLLGLVKF